MNTFTVNAAAVNTPELEEEICANEFSRREDLPASMQSVHGCDEKKNRRVRLRKVTSKISSNNSRAVAVSPKREHVYATAPRWAALRSIRRLLQMKRCAVRIFVLAVLLLSPIVALPLDQNSAVKVTSLLKTTKAWDGEQIVYPEGQAEVTALLVEIAPGESTGWHQHPVPSFGFLVEGTLEITLVDGRVKRMEPGEALSEVTDTMHNGRAVSKTPVKIVVFYAGVIDKALTINHPSSANLPR
jgi:quercetin dioxygenase-like cupin family protein